MSQTDVGKSVGRDEKLVRNFIKQKQSEYPSDGRYLVRTIEAETGFNNNGKIKAIFSNLLDNFIQ